jgi:hypothetical protein
MLIKNSIVLAYYSFEMHLSPSWLLWINKGLLHLKITEHLVEREQ